MSFPGSHFASSPRRCFGRKTGLFIYCLHPPKKTFISMGFASDVNKEKRYCPENVFVFFFFFFLCLGGRSGGFPGSRIFPFFLFSVWGVSRIQVFFLFFFFCFFSRPRKKTKNKGFFLNRKKQKTRKKPGSGKPPRPTPQTQKNRKKTEKT